MHLVGSALNEVQLQIGQLELCNQDATTSNRVSFQCQSTQYWTQSGMVQFDTWPESRAVEGQCLDQLRGERPLPVHQEVAQIAQILVLKRKATSFETCTASELKQRFMAIDGSRQR